MPLPPIHGGGEAVRKAKQKMQEERREDSSPGDLDLERYLNALESGITDVKRRRSSISEGLGISLDIMIPALRLLRHNLPSKNGEREGMTPLPAPAAGDAMPLSHFHGASGSLAEEDRPNDECMYFSGDSALQVLGAEEESIVAEVPSGGSPKHNRRLDFTESDEDRKLNDIRNNLNLRNDEFMDSRDDGDASVSCASDGMEDDPEGDVMTASAKVSTHLSKQRTFKLNDHFIHMIKGGDGEGFQDLPDVGSNAADFKVKTSADVEDVEDVESAKHWLRKRTLYNDHCFIHPDQPRRLTWDVCSMLMILLLTIVIPFELGFMWHDGENYLGLVVLHTFSDIWFSTDIVLNCFTGHYRGVGARRHLVTRPTMIIRSYARGWLWIDLLATIPFWRIVQAFTVDGSDGQSSKSIGVLRALKVAKATRILKVLRALKLGGLMQALEEQFMLVHSMTVAFQLAKLSSLMLLVSHVVACVWFAAGFWSSEFYELTWLRENDLIDAPRWHQWVSSFYFAIVTGTTVGYGDIHATNAIEQVCGVILLICAVAFLAQSVSRLGQVVASLMQAEAEVMRVKRVAMLFCRTRNVPRELYVQVVRYIEHVHGTDSMTSLDNTGFLEKLSLPLQKKLRRAIIGNFLRKIPIFADAADSFITGICAACHTQRSGMGDILVQEDESYDSLFFIVRGEVKLTKAERQVGVLREEDWFGVRALFQDTLVHTVTMTCETDCEFLVLARKDFLKQVMQFPNVEEEYDRMILELSKTGAIELKQAPTKQDARRGSIADFTPHLGRKFRQPRWARRTSRNSQTSLVGTVGSHSSAGYSHNGNKRILTPSGSRDNQVDSRDIMSGTSSMRSLGTEDT